MKIIDHRLHHDDGTPVRFVKTPNVGGKLVPTWLVMHYTAGSSAAESISWLANREAKASAHLVIARDGAVTQMVPFDQVAWHAGKSAWKGVTGLNSRSIGIELDNPGRVAKKSGAWMAFGRKVPEAEVLVATHKNETTPSGWARYPQAQLDVALEIARLLVRTYGLKDVIGHDDISPGRKQDPGPAFPMESFRAAALGAGEPGPAPTPERPGTRFRVTTRLNVRTGPSRESEKVAGSPLPPDTIVLGFEDAGDWKRIAAEEPVGGIGVAGWAASEYLEPLPGGAVPPAGEALFRATTRLNIRDGAGKEHAAVTTPLAAGTLLRELEDAGEWKHVSVLDDTGEPVGVSGWVSARYLEPAEA